MLYENVKAILDVSKEENVDLLVARDKLMVLHPEKAEDYKEADAFIGKYYEFIAKCRVNGDEDVIKQICEMYFEGNTEGIKELINKADV